VLNFLGRFDHQIKIRGFRVELGEIEAALCTHSSVREACVVVHQAGSSEPRLTAYVVPRWNPGAPEEWDLRLHMARTMPDHMIPSELVILTAMPLSPNGKIDRSALPDPAGRVRVAPAAAGRAVVAEPQSSEAVLLDIWRTVLRRQLDDRDQNFFDAGGTSLSLAEVQASIRTRLGKEVPIVTLFAHPTIASLARHLDQDRLPQGVAKMAALKQVEALRRLAMARGKRQ